MNNSLLLTRPSHDLTTNYLYHWAALVINEAEKKNFKVYDLKDKKANQKSFAGIVKKTQPDLIYLNGHGSADFVCGDNDEIIVQKDRDEFLLKDKIVYALSCQSAKNLGPSCIKKGTTAYLGYDDDFIFLYDEHKITRPTSDNIAENFLEPSNLLILSIIKGNSVKISFRRSQNSFKEKIIKILNSESHEQDFNLVSYLSWDMKHQVCLGDQDAKI